MTKPKNTARRAEDWAFDMPAGRALHTPTGLEFILQPLDTDQPAAFERLQALGWRNTGLHRLPNDVEDRRQVQLDLRDANAPRFKAWHVMVNLKAHQATQDRLAAAHGPFQGKDMLERICREAGERWVFRARLERGWPDGRRAT
jgi:hypothetical protein